MYDEKRFLTAKEILDKDFKIDARGYRPQEVDQFLDLIIKDYVDFETTTKRLVTEIKALEADNAKLKAEVRNMKSALEIANSNKGVTNVDLLKKSSLWRRIRKNNFLGKRCILIYVEESPYSLILK